MSEFDPNATPWCASIAEEPTCWFHEAMELERRARVAEEKLRIAVEALKQIASPGNNFEHPFDSSNKALEEIEKLGQYWKKSRGWANERTTNRI